MTPEALAEMIKAAKELGESMKKNFKSKPVKPWKILSGVEWTQRCLDDDWIKDRPKMGGGWKLTEKERSEE